MTPKGETRRHIGKSLDKYPGTTSELAGQQLKTELPRPVLFQVACGVLRFGNRKISVTKAEGETSRRHVVSGDPSESNTCSPPRARLPLSDPVFLVTTGELTGRTAWTES